MKKFAMYLLLAALSLGTAQGQGEDLVGTWEMEDEDYLQVFEFRADGILIHNEFLAFGDEPELECVYVFPYAVDGDVLTVGEGLNWFFDDETGEFEFYEDYAEEAVEVTFLYDVSDGELTLELDNNQLTVALLEYAEDLGLYLDSDLGFDINDPEEAIDLDLSDEELDEIVATMFIATVESMVSFEMNIDLDIELDLDGEDELVSTVFEAVTISILEDMLEVDLEGFDLDLEGDEDAVDILLSLLEEMGLEPEEDDLEDMEEDEDVIALNRALELMNESLDEVEAGLEGIGELVLAPSSVKTAVPSEPFQLPNGATAVQEQSWGRIKSMHRR